MDDSSYFARGARKLARPRRHHGLMPASGRRHHGAAPSFDGWALTGFTVSSALAVLGVGVAVARATRKLSSGDDGPIYGGSGAALILGAVGAALTWPKAFPGGSGTFTWDEAYDAIILYNRKLDAAQQGR